MDDLEMVLADLAPRLAVGPSVTSTVLQRIEGDRVRHVAVRRRLSLAAAFIVVTMSGLLASGAATSVARWFGLDGLTLRFSDDPAPTAPATAPLPGPGHTTVVEVDGRRIVVSVIDGTLTPGLLGKTIGPGTDVESVFVDDQQGLWISGAPHEVLYESGDGEVKVERMSGNTLLWQGDGVLYRLEGFDDLDSALGFAQSLQTQ